MNKPLFHQPKKRGNLSSTLCLLGMLILPLSSVHAAGNDLEIDELRLGFIKLTDMAPLAIAYERGYFEDEGYMSRWKHRQIGECYWMV
jgi:ABC-type nitrate/sulfonate/bicarbonate transport system substrate-binding protein